MTALAIAKSAIHMTPPPGVSALTRIAITPQYILASFLLIPYRNSLGLINPILTVGWTLSFEMLFYFLFAAALLLKTNVPRFLSIILLALSAIGLFRGDGWPAATVLISPLLLEFLAGVLLGAAVQKGFTVKRAPATLLGLTGLVGILTVSVPNIPGGRPLTWGIAAFLLVLGTVMLEGYLRIPKWMLMIGDASYSLYLFHVFVIQGLARIELSTAWHEEIAMVTLSVVCSALSAVFIYLYLEQPINRAARPKAVASHS